MSILVRLVSLLPVFSQEFLALINCLLAVWLLGEMTWRNISKWAELPIYLYLNPCVVSYWVNIVKTTKDTGTGFFKWKKIAFIEIVFRKYNIARNRLCFYINQYCNENTEDVILSWFSLNFLFFLRGQKTHRYPSIWEYKQTLAQRRSQFYFQYRA